MRAFGTAIATAQVAAMLCACGGGGSGAAEAAQGGSITVVHALPGTTEATLSWDASSDSPVSGYRVYVGNASRYYFQAKGSGINAGLVTTYQVQNLRGSTTYYFAVTAYDQAGNESDYSKEVAFLVP